MRVPAAKVALFEPWPRLARAAVILAAGTAWLAGAVGTARGAWTELSPPCRTAHSVIYDPVRDRLISFGGYDGQVRNGVWVLPLSGAPLWTLLSPIGTPPAPRSDHTAIYDPVGDRVMVFGGSDGTPFDDLWELSLSGAPQWTALIPSGSPPAARSGHAAIYDPLRQRMIVLFGQGDSGVLADAWALSLGGSPAWSPLGTQGGPPPARMRHSAIYDPTRDRIVLFGGDQGAQFSVLGDTWALSLGTTPSWSLLVPSGSGPDPRSRANAVYDPAGDRMILHSGAIGPSFFTFDDLWELSLATDQWTLRAYFQPLLHAAGAVYDPPRSRMLITGGSHHVLATFSYTLALPLAPLGPWTTVVSAGPGAIASQTAVFDPVRERMVTFGGQTKGLLDISPRNDAWIYQPETGVWSDVPDIGPSPRIGHAAVFDAPRDRMLVFGGDEVYGPVHNDTWSLDFDPGPAWTELLPGGTPPPAREGHSLVRDPAADRLLVFGGSTTGHLGGPPNPLNDLWQLALSPSPVWTLLSPAGTPPKPRRGHTAVYDATGHRMIVFGGHDGSVRLNDVWALTLGGSPTWQELAPAGVPPTAREGHVAIYDPAAHRMIVFGGFASAGTVSETWSLTLGPSPGWGQLNLPGPTPGRPWLHSAAYDPENERMLVYGGYGASGLWALPLAGTTGVGASVAPQGIALAPPRPNPAAGPLVAAFTLPDATPATLELFDTAGRRVASREVGSLGAGPHRAVLATERSLSPGIYLMRLTHRAGSLTVRTAVVR